MTTEIGESSVRYLPMFADWHVFEPIRKHKTFILVFILSATLSALALTYIYSEKYDATATIVMSPYAVSAIRQDEPRIFGAQAPTATFKSITQSVEDLSTSKPILQDLVTKFHLDQDDRDYSAQSWYMRLYHETRDEISDAMTSVINVLMYGRDIDDPMKTAMDRLGNDIKVTNDESYVFTIRVRDKKQERALLIVERLAHKITGTIRDQGKNPARIYAENINKLVTERQAEIASIEAETTRLLASHNIASIDNEIEKGVSRLNDLLTEQTRLMATLDGEKQKIATLNDKLGKGANRVSQSGAPGREVASLVAIGDPRSKGSTSLSPSELIQPADYSKMITDKLSAEVDLASDRSRYNALDASTTELRNWLETLPAVKSRLNILQAESERAKRTYLLVSDEATSLAMREANSMAELQVQGPAYAPSTPKTPIKLYHVGLALLLGALTAIALTFFFVYFNIRLFADSLGPSGRGRPPETPNTERRQMTA